MVTTIVCCSRAWRVNVCDADSLVISRRGGDEVDKVGGEHQVPKPSSLLLLSPLTNHHNEPSSSSIHHQKQIFRHFTVRTKKKTKQKKKRKNHSKTQNHTVLAIPSPLLNLSFAFLIIGQYFCSLPSRLCVHTHIYKAGAVLDNVGKACVEETTTLDDKSSKRASGPSLGFTTLVTRKPSAVKEGHDCSSSGNGAHSTSSAVRKLRVWSGGMLQLVMMCQSRYFMGEKKKTAHEADFTWFVETDRLQHTFIF